MYHSLDDSGSAISLDPKTFSSHVRWLASGLVRVLPLELLPGDAEDGDAVALTFDDAFTSFESVAAPLLREHDLPATVFVVSGRTGGTNSWGGVTDPRIPTLQLLDWEAIGKLCRDGFTIGAHTRTHPRLGSLSGSRLTDEIAGSAVDIEAHVGARPTSFAYPYGELCAEAIECVRNNYGYACTTDLRVFSGDEDFVMLPRLDAYYFRTPASIEAWGSPAFLRSVRRRAFARRVRSHIRERLQLGKGIA